MAFNWAATGQGALSGAATGFGIGGPWGAAAGGILGGLGGYFGGKSSSSSNQGRQLQGRGGPMGQNPQIPGYESGYLNQYTPEQQQLFKQQIGMTGPNSQLGRLAAGDQSQFAQLEAPGLQQFNELLGGIRSEYGGAGGEMSSGAQNAQTTAASSFAQQLQSNRMGLQRQAMQDLRGMSQELLGNRPYEQYILPQQQSGLQSFFTGIAPGIAQGLAQAGGSYALNRWGGGGTPAAPAATPKD
jgi:hypothetical protein